MQQILFALAIAVTAALGCGGTPYKRIATGYRTVNYSARLAEDFDGALATYLQAQRDTCKAKHGLKTPGFDTCILPTLRVARTWTGKVDGVDTGKGVLPTLQSAQKVTRLSLDATYDYIQSHEKECTGKAAPAKCTGDWMALMRPVLCATAEVVDRAVKLGAYKTTDDATYKLVMGFVSTLACAK